MNKSLGVTLANSSSKNERIATDFYPTPPEVTLALLRELKLNISTKIWEPACGEGHMATIMKDNGYSVECTDLFNKGYGEYEVDFTKEINNRGCDWIITNPPFKESVGFIETAASLQVDGFAFLLKSQYWHSKKRLQLFEKFPPALIMPLTWRPDFLFGKRGGSPTMECLWTVWIKGDTRAEYRPLKKPTEIRNNIEEFF